MQNSEKLCLKWNDFQENTISSFEVLRNDQEFADVTLACEYGTQVEAHKVILLGILEPIFYGDSEKKQTPTSADLHEGDQRRRHGRHG